MFSDLVNLFTPDQILTILEVDHDELTVVENDTEPLRDHDPVTLNELLLSNVEYLVHIETVSSMSIYVSVSATVRKSYPSFHAPFVDAPHVVTVCPPFLGRRVV